MKPSDHLDWFDENVRWFAELDVASYGVAVPNCPGWSIEKVITHLAIGLGLAYPYAMRKAPDGAAEDAFADVPWPTAPPTGSAARRYFVAELDRCAGTFRSTEPTLPCWTYAGPGAASFWFRRAAIETTIHRFDVVQALGRNDELTFERAIDAVIDTVEFVLPLAAAMTGSEPGALAVVCEESGCRLQVGTGEQLAEVAGPAATMLMALWGRRVEGMVITGDVTVARQWLGRIERAFAGR